MYFSENILFKKLKSEPPTWWTVINDDPEIHAEIRKDKYIDAYFNGGAVIKELTWSDEKGYQAKIHAKYLSDTNDDSYCDCPLDKLPEILEDIKERIRVHYPNNSEKGIQSKLILDAHGDYIDCEFQDRYNGIPIRIDLVKAKNDTIVFQELKRIEDSRLLKKSEDGHGLELNEIVEQMSSYADYIKENKDTLLKYYKNHVDTKQITGLNPRSFFVRSDELTIDPIPELIISDYAEPYSETSRKGKRVKALMEKLDDACIRYSFVNINVDGYYYKQMLLNQKEEKWDLVFEMIPWLEKVEAIDPAATYTDHRGTRTRPLKYVESKTASVQLIGRIASLFEPFDWKSWTEGQEILNNERFAGLDIVSLMKLLAIKLYYKDQGEGNINLIPCNASDLDDGKVLKILRELKLRYDEYAAQKKALQDQEIDQYHVRYSGDSDFARKSRLLQSKWRVAHNYPIGKTSKGTIMGNYIESSYAKEYKVNLLTDNIRRIAELELGETASTGALIQESRLWENMLSSQPLCFNLFGEMHYDLELATAFFKESFPQRYIEKVTSVRFEQSPGRGNKSLTGDHSAFDVFVEYNGYKGSKGFIGIEVKYAETLREGIDKDEMTFKRHKDEYIRVSRNAVVNTALMGTAMNPVFEMDKIEEMAHAPKFQIWRDHLLALSMLQNNLYDEGFFLFLYPKQNEECRVGVKEYTEALHLNFGNWESHRCFYARDIFEFIERLHKMVNKPWSRDLLKRYTGQTQ